MRRNCALLILLTANFCLAADSPQLFTEKTLEITSHALYAENFDQKASAGVGVAYQHPVYKNIFKLGIGLSYDIGNLFFNGREYQYSFVVNHDDEYAVLHKGTRTQSGHVLNMDLAFSYRLGKVSLNYIRETRWFVGRSQSWGVEISPSGVDSTNWGGWGTEIRVNQGSLFEVGYHFKRIVPKVVLGELFGIRVGYVLKSWEKACRP